MIDCEAYTQRGRTLLCEVSVYCIRENKCSSYQINFLCVDFNERDRCVKYQIDHVHGLPVVHSRLDDNFFTYNEVMMLLQMEFMKNADLVAYKGGTIERDMLYKMGVKGINIEIIGCEKYAELLTKYGIVAECFPYHVYDTCHCSKHEVQVFNYFLQEVLNDTNWNYDTEKNDYTLERLSEKITRRENSKSFVKLQECLLMHMKIV